MKKLRNATANSRAKLPPPLRYSIDELANAWGVSESYIWQQIEAGRLHAVARGRGGKWHPVDPFMGQEIDFGSKGLCGGVTVICKGDDGSNRVVHSEEIDWDTKNVRVMHKDRMEFEANSVREAELSLRAETTYLNIIAALLECIAGNLPKVDKHPSFESEAKLIEAIDHHYRGIGGLSSSNLTRKFPKAKRSLANN